MSAYELARVLEKWDREELTTEQAIGQLLLLVESLNRRVGEIERRLERLRRFERHPAADSLDPAAESQPQEDQEGERLRQGETELPEAGQTRDSGEKKGDAGATTTVVDGGGGGSLLLLQPIGLV